MQVSPSPSSPYVSGASTSRAPAAAAGRNSQNPQSSQTSQNPQSSQASQNATSQAAQQSAPAAATQRLSPEQLAQVLQLKTRDSEVKRHEQAHLSAAGGLAVGAPSYSYQTGPDGKQYAIGGEVSIDMSPGSTPEQTLRKADTIRAAALAPAKPSGADLAIAAAASAMALQAQLQIALAAHTNGAQSPPGTSSSRAAQATSAYDDSQNDRTALSLNIVA
jgi:hypothetical protein